MRPESVYPDEPAAVYGLRAWQARKRAAAEELLAEWDAVLAAPVRGI